MHPFAVDGGEGQLLAQESAACLSSRARCRPAVRTLPASDGRRPDKSGTHLAVQGLVSEPLTRSLAAGGRLMGLRSLGALHFLPCLSTPILPY